MDAWNVMAIILLLFALPAILYYPTCIKRALQRDLNYRFWNAHFCVYSHLGGVLTAVHFYLWQMYRQKLFQPDCWWLTLLEFLGALLLFGGSTVKYYKFQKTSHASAAQSTGVMFVISSIPFVTVGGIRIGNYYNHEKTCHWMAMSAAIGIVYVLFGIILAFNTARSRMGSSTPFIKLMLIETSVNLAIATLNVLSIEKTLVDAKSALIMFFFLIGILPNVTFWIFLYQVIYGIADVASILEQMEFLNGMRTAPFRRLFHGEGSSRSHSQPLQSGTTDITEHAHLLQQLVEKDDEMGISRLFNDLGMSYLVVNHVDKDLRTIAHKAAMTLSIKAAQFLLRNNYINKMMLMARDRHGLTPLHYVADTTDEVWTQQRSRMFDLFLEYMDEVDFPDHNGMTVMHYVAKYVRSVNSVIPDLVEKNADPSLHQHTSTCPKTFDYAHTAPNRGTCTTQIPKSPLFVAVETGNYEAIPLFVVKANRAMMKNMGTPCTHGTNALHLAVRLDDVLCADAILKSGICGAHSVNELDGCNSIHYACMNCNEKMLKLIIENVGSANGNSSPNSSNNDSFSSRSFFKCSSEFEEVMRRNVQCYEESINDEDMKRLKFEVAQRIPILEREGNRQEALMLRHALFYYLKAQTDSSDRTTLQDLSTHLTLVETVNAVDKNGKTPLHYSIRVKSVELVKILIQAGANPRAKPTPSAGGKIIRSPFDLTDDLEPTLQSSMRSVMEEFDKR